jgi:hypothetical protein
VFEAFAENQDGDHSHCDDVSPRQQHREQHQCPTGTGAPNPMGNPEAKRVEIGRRAKRG